MQTNYDLEFLVFINEFLEDSVLYKCVFPILLLINSLSLSNSKLGSENENELWRVIERKLTIDYARDFSSQDLEKFIKYFAPNRKIDVYQFGGDVSGNDSYGKHMRFYNGNMFASLIRLRIPTKLMAKTLFRRLKKQNYKESKIDLLGIVIENNFIGAYFRFDRINNNDILYHSARGFYKLKKIVGVWYIVEMNTYHDSDAVNALVGYDRMMKSKGDIQKTLLD